MSFGWERLPRVLQCSLSSVGCFVVLGGRILLVCVHVLVNVVHYHKDGMRVTNWYSVELETTYS